MEELTDKAEQLRSLLAQMVDLPDEDRARIARSLQDAVVQLTTALRYEIKAFEVTWGRGQVTAAVANLGTAREVLEELEFEIRRAIPNLHPPLLDVGKPGSAFRIPNK